MSVTFQFARRDGAHVGQGLRATVDIIYVKHRGWQGCTKATATRRSTIASEQAQAAVERFGVGVGNFQLGEHAIVIGHGSGRRRQQ